MVVVLNEMIKENKVMVINEKGENEGLISTFEALNRARELGVDLVKLDSKSEVPVCKIIDYKKFKYEQSKKSKLNKETKVKWKEVQLKLNIGDNDLFVKASNISRFLSKGHKIKIVLVLKGREINNAACGIELINKLKTLVNDEFKITKEAKLEGNRIITHLEK